MGQNKNTINFSKLILDHGSQSGLLARSRHADTMACELKLELVDLPVEGSL